MLESGRGIRALLGPWGLRLTSASAPACGLRVIQVTQCCDDVKGPRLNIGAEKITNCNAILGGFLSIAIV